MRISCSCLQSTRVCSGWSLLELLVALTLVAILASIATPQIYASWQLQSLYDERQRLAQQIRFARLSSLQKSAKVSLCWSAACGSSVGFVVYLDVNKDGYWQSTEVALSQWQLKHDVTYSFNHGVQISFNKAGNTAQSGTILLCGSNTKQGMGYALVLSSSGRLREKAAPCT